jgi:hypothetical protein
MKPETKKAKAEWRKLENQANALARKAAKCADIEATLAHKAAKLREAGSTTTEHRPVADKAWRRNLAKLEAASHAKNNAKAEAKAAETASHRARTRYLAILESEGGPEQPKIYHHDPARLRRSIEGGPGWEKEWGAAMKKKDEAKAKAKAARESRKEAKAQAKPAPKAPLRAMAKASDYMGPGFPPTPAAEEMARAMRARSPEAAGKHSRAAMDAFLAQAGYADAQAREAKREAKAAAGRKGRPVKGSAEAIAWAAKMKDAREAAKAARS